MAQTPNVCMAEVDETRFEMMCCAMEVMDVRRCATPKVTYSEAPETEEDVSASDSEEEEEHFLQVPRSAFGAAALSPALSDATTTSAQSNWTPGCDSEPAPLCYQEELGNQEFVLNPMPAPSVTDCLAPVIADVLANVTCGHNTAAQNSAFMSKFPMMHLTDYVLRFSQCSGLTVSPYVAALMLVHRLSETHAEIITPYTIHRIFLTALSIGHKAVEEYQLMNSTTACIGGVSTSELKECEFEFVRLLDWEVGVNEAKLTGYLQTLCHRARLPIETVGNVGFLGA